jgi:hypothetical protein
MASFMDRLLGRKKQPPPERKVPTPREMAIQEMNDEKMRAAMEKAYNEAMPSADPEYDAKHGPRKAKGGKVKKYAKGGAVRGDGACMRGHTKGRMI